MPFLLNAATPALCGHGGKATPAVPNPRVKAGGTPTALQSTPCTEAGCPFVTPVGSPLPCVTGNWIMGAMRVRSGGQPLVLDNSPSLATPTATPLNVISIPARVKAT